MWSETIKLTIKSANLNWKIKMWQLPCQTFSSTWKNWKRSLIQLCTMRIIQITHKILKMKTMMTVITNLMLAVKKVMLPLKKVLNEAELTVIKMNISLIMTIQTMKMKKFMILKSIQMTAIMVLKWMRNSRIRYWACL